MNTNNSTDFPQRNRIHPLVAGAAVAVMLVSVTGIAAMTGLLPTSHAVTAPPEQAASTPMLAQAASGAVTSPAQQPAVEPRVTREKTVDEPRVHHHHSAPAAPSPAYTSNQGYGEATRPVAQQPAYDPNAGEVVAVNAVQTAQPTTGVGAVGGAIAGGLLGNQIGGGRGRVLTTIAGAIGGGLAGNGIEHEVHKATSYQVQVRMRDGSYRNFTYNQEPAFGIGEHVRVMGDTLMAS
ncbi:glycine zipper 2TM domain-containing protein [Trinickia fusca]|uniref:Glycine zipper 2TM domain-containing protein n=1 Tax=Trinickia fusca TaxID=2419777 RepID=A0A494X2G1_9BURK|nr:glycine zipper 2TM domain-containing protein [Trinickia fusca]RKP44542.1 glycine zipper 2TM domain-containing protein [Trinickia fusca]